MDKVVKFYPNNAAENPDNVLEQAIGEYDKVMVIGYNKSDELDARASLNLSVSEAHYLVSLVQKMFLDHSSEEIEVI